MSALMILLMLMPFPRCSDAQVPPQPEDINVKGTSFLDHESPIHDFAGKTFLRENIPYIDIPDRGIEEVYYYRWASLARHLHYSIAGAGFVLTEFVQPVGYAKTFSTIDAAAGHQIDEARWFRSKFYSDDYVRFWTRGPGDSVAYTHWIMDATYRKSLVDGNVSFLTSQLQGMLQLWHQWDFTFDSTNGLYYYTPTADAQEFSLPGWIASNGGMNNISLLNTGPDTYRPSHNAYMVGNARAIARTAQLAGNGTVAEEYHSIADNLESAMFEHLWDEELHFFVDVIRRNNYSMGHSGPVKGREEVGLYPFRFGIGLSSNYANPSLQELFDPEGFQAPYGPTTLERRSEYYDMRKPTVYCCYWNGQSWPFSTAHVLKSVAAAYRTGNLSVTAEQYYTILKRYAETQRDVYGRPFVAEAHYSEVDAWSAYTTNHSEHYDHSTCNDDIITGLIGLVPRSDNILQVSPIIPQNWTYFALENVAYHGHLITILYDANGARYNVSAGLSIYVDGQQAHSANLTSALISLPGNTSNSDLNIPVNIAANPHGPGHWPKATATYTYDADSVWKAIDGSLFYDYIPDNRWTNNQSYHFNDTYGLAFARPRHFSSITLAIYADRDTGGTIDCPKAVEVYGDSGLLANVSDFGGRCLPNDRNTISFGREILSRNVWINMFTKRGYAVGVAELEIWVPPNHGPVYYLVDAYLTNALVTFDTGSRATVNGAVVGNSGVESQVLLPGVYSGIGGKATLILSYKNRGSETAIVGVEINRYAAGNFSLVPTGQTYSTVGLQAELLPGDNFLTFYGSNENVLLETLRVS